MNTSIKNFKQQAHELVDQLPDTATWPDLIDYAAERQDLEIAQFYSEYESGRFAEEGQVAEKVVLDYDGNAVKKRPDVSEAPGG